MKKFEVFRPDASPAKISAAYFEISEKNVLVFRNDQDELVAAYNSESWGSVVEIK